MDVKARRSRRRLLRATLGWGLVAASAGCAPSTVRPPSPGPGTVPTPTVLPVSRFTTWGWPLPYEPVSVQSIDWLQQRDWWPLGVGYHPLWSGLNAVVAMMTTYQLPALRGLQTTFYPHETGSALEQAYVAGRIQAGNAGDVSTALLIERGAPVASVAVEVPNLKIGTVVPNESPLHNFAALHRSGLELGVELNSLAIGYVAASAYVNRIAINRDFFIVEISTQEQAILPSDVAGVAPWDPVLSSLVTQQHTGRTIDVVFPYHFVNGHLIVRSELIDNVPDVVQALVDSYQEAILLVRLRPRQAAAILSTDRRLERYSTGLLLAQTMAYNNLYKPTFAYPFPDFWAAENAFTSSLLAANGQITAPISAETWNRFLIPRFMERAYARLGWRVPDRPPWIPADWPGTAGNPPYPSYANVDTLRQPQQWPEKGDLTRPWQFAGTTHYP